MPETISLCVIARNEARLIGQCIKSALPLVDQIVVIDTGSSDQTPEIARNLGVEVWEYPWHNDFSAARNFALEKARCQWILIMDCDEEIDASTGNTLLSVVGSKDYDAYYINVINLVGENKSLAFQSIRLFRNLPQFRYEGKIHEQIAHSIVRHSGKDRIGRCNFTLLHHGYNPEKINIQAKVARNLKLLAEQGYHSEIPKGFFLYNLGIEYVRQGQYQQALEKFIESLKVTDINSGYAPALVNKTIVCLIELRRFRDALEQLSYFQSIYPDYSDLYLLEAACHIKCGRFSLALEGIEKARQVTSYNVNYPIEGTIFGKTPEKLLSEIEPYCIQKKSFKVSVCILAKNEEKGIAKCIHSVGELADEILLVTTDSTDNTLPIAYEMGANLIRLQWQNSLAELRNFALQRATGDWILFLNGDEEINQSDIPVLIERLDKSSSAAHIVRLRTFNDANNSISFEDQAVCRIIRNDKDLGYKSNLIEDVEQSVTEKHGDTSITYLPVTIFHHGPVLKPQSRSSVFRRNILLLIKEMKTSGKSTSLYQALGDEFYKMGRWKVALVFYKHLLGLATNQIPAELGYRAVDCLLKLGHVVDALVLANQTASYHPNYTDIIYLQGRCQLSLGNLDTAAACFQRCLELGESDWREYPVHSGISSYLSHCGLAEVYRNQGDDAMCLKHYRVAASDPAGVSAALPPLVKAIIDKQGPGHVLSYLKENGLASCQYLASAASHVLNSGHLAESLQLWQAAVNDFKTNGNLSHYQLISSSMFQILSAIYRQAVDRFPDSPPLRRVANFFSYRDTGIVLLSR